MSNSASEEEMFVYPYDKWKESAESILTQKITKLSKSESMFKYSEYSPSLRLSQLNFKGKHLKKLRETNWDLVHEKCRFPRLIQTRSLLRDELEMLKINLSMHEKVVTMRESQLDDARAREAWRREGRRVRRGGRQFNRMALLDKLRSPKVTDLLTEIDGSETAKRDKVCWKFLKRGPAARREANETKRLSQHLKGLAPPVLELLSDSHFQKAQPIKITCPNCRFFIITQVKKISTLRTKLTAFLLTCVRFCLAPRTFYAFSNCVHLCPLCKIYLGFCPAFSIRLRKKELKSESE